MMRTTQPTRGGGDPPKRSEEREGTPEAVEIHYTRRADGASEARARRRGLHPAGYGRISARVYNMCVLDLVACFGAKM